MANQICPKYDTTPLIRNEQAIVPPSYSAVAQKAIQTSVSEFNKDIAGLSSAMHKMNIEHTELKKVTNAHQDDIHVLQRLSSGNILSGSKDGHLKIWDCTAEIKCVNDLSRNDAGYQYWITAVTVFEDGSWVSGTRDGLLTYFSDSGEFLSEGAYQSPTFHKCKERNVNRINCITPKDKSSSLQGVYIGMPCFFRWLGPDGTCKSYTKVSNNDWVYCIEHFSDKNTLAVVTGSNLSLFYAPEKTGRWTESVKLIQEEKKSNTRLRPHISSICLLDQSTLAVADFYGQIKVLDCTRADSVNAYEEHQGRAWKVVKLDEQTFASSADDATVKIWDVREHESVRTITQFPGRVSNLLYLEDQQVLVTGSCPDDIRHANIKAELSFINLPFL